MQLDFGETEQDKSVNLIEVHAKQPSTVTRLPIDAGVRRLVDIGTPGHGVSLNDLISYKDAVGDAWLRVFVDLDLPVANLPALVRETLPNAVHVERIRPATTAAPVEPGKTSTPEEMFATFYRGHSGRDATPQTLDLFRRLLLEEADATAEA
jgi:hypothetical protein